MIYEVFLSRYKLCLRRGTYTKLLYVKRIFIYPCINPLKHDSAPDECPLFDMNISGPNVITNDFLTICNRIT